MAMCLCWLFLRKFDHCLQKVTIIVIIFQQRCNPPSEDEVDKWLKKYFRPFPKIGHIRLPLHYICELNPKDAFKFVSGEFQLASYKAWIESARVFRFKGDNIRILTVHNTIQVWWSHLQ
jgi:hypothetical protein